MYFGLSTVLTDVLPDAVAKFLIDYKKSQEFQLMKDEWYYCKQYKIEYFVFQMDIVANEKLYTNLL